MGTKNNVKNRKKKENQKQAASNIEKKEIRSRRRLPEKKVPSLLQLLPRLLGLVVVAVAIYFGKKYYKSIEEVNTKFMPDTDNDTKPVTIGKVTRLPDYDSKGYVVGRPLPEVIFMPASAASEYEIKNPEDLPYVKYLEGPPMKTRRERAMGARFKNFYNFELTMWWDDGTEEGQYSGGVSANGNTATNTYTTHAFLFKKKSTGELLHRIVMSDDRHLYFIGPAEGDVQTLNSQKYKDALAEVEFMKQYHKENGVPWLSTYPRGPPVLFLYPADFVGQKHKIISKIGYFGPGATQSKEPVSLAITVVSTSPRVLLVQNLLSDFEIDHIISMGEKVVKRSMVGSSSDGFTSKTRTSENGWLKRSQSTVLNTVYYRFADVLRMSDKQLKDDGTGAAENLQFVRYLETQRYDPHHDFGYTGREVQRFSTLLIYLEIPEEGGGTSFPKAFDGQGIKVKPSKGDAVLFYSMLPDGNGDDMSLHAGMPVEKGRKFVCNLWSWDPHYF